jgi:hypothetical protein
MPESVVVSQIAWDASFFLPHITPISVYRSTIKSKFAKKKKINCASCQRVFVKNRQKPVSVIDINHKD